MQRRETAHAQRVEIVERHLAGETLAVIAQALGLSRFTARFWWRVYHKEGWPALEPVPKGPSTVGLLGRFSPRIKYVALRLKLEHPAWGSPMLLLHLQRRPSLRELLLPKETALWNYLHQFGTRLVNPRRPRTSRPTLAVGRAEAPHQCWEMDFKGDEPLAPGAPIIAPWAVSDEASGAPLARFMHALQARGNRQGLTTRHVQGDLRRVFTQWGLPEALRMDRDSLFIGSSRLEWPGFLLCWLVGLGVQPIINRSYRPTDNALVERSHRTWKSDVLVGGHYLDLLAVQIASDQALEDRRLYLPSRHRGCHHQPPAVAFPALLNPRRLYQPEQEQSLFDLRRVDAYLAQWDWRRQVDREGKICLAGHNLFVGRPYRRQVVKVRFDPPTREFVCSGVTGEELARFTLVEVSLDYILGKGV